MRRFIRRQLAEDFRLIEAKDGDEGFELAQHSVPDLILTDLMMPKVNGLQLSERLRNAYATSHIPIIVLTAKALKQDRIESFNAGVDEFITKPFDAEFLNRRIHNLINSRLQLQKSYQSDSVKRIESPRNIENLFIENLHTFVRKNISHSNLLISDLASHVHMSERSLNRKLNAIEGLSPNQWLLRSKLTIAREKLRYSTDSVTKIALETGFTDSSHFSKSFKKIHSISPIQYRKSVN